MWTKRVAVRDLCAKPPVIRLSPGVTSVRFSDGVLEELRSFRGAPAGNDQSQAEFQINGDSCFDKKPSTGKTNASSA